MTYCSSYYDYICISCYWTCSHRRISVILAVWLPVVSVHLQLPLVFKRWSQKGHYVSTFEGWDRLARLNVTVEFFQALGQRPIFANVAHNCGFLHRLDIPSSGLIVAATTFEVGQRGSNQLAYPDVSGCISWMRDTGSVSFHIQGLWTALLGQRSLIHWLENDSANWGRWTCSLIFIHSPVHVFMAPGLLWLAGPAGFWANAPWIFGASAWHLAVTNAVGDLAGAAGGATDTLWRTWKTQQEPWQPITG